MFRSEQGLEARTSLLHSIKIHFAAPALLTILALAAITGTTAQATEDPPQSNAIVSTSESPIESNVSQAPAADVALLRSASQGQHLALSKKALEKEFLIRASLIPQTQAATSEGTLSRVVQFRRRGNRVFLMESPQGQVVTRELPSQLILAEIPVISENDQELVLDFNAGMQRVFVASNWHTTDSQGRDYSPENRAMGVEVSHSFIENIRTQRQTTEIRQIVQLRLDHSFFPTYEVRYYLSPYQPNPQFQSHENNRPRQVGFFETAPVLEQQTGRSTVNITRWNIAGRRRPLVYHISANTPPEYIEAVREGILYWNKAFGREVLQAKVAPTSATAPDSRHNLIQWVPWENAGFAYADALSDPRTGEILNAQVYLTSVFAFSSKEKVRRLLRALQENEQEEEDHTNGDAAAHQHHHHHHGPHHDHKAGLNFLQSGNLCHLDAIKHLPQALEKMIESNLDDAAILRLSQDMVRSVVAHEVGHTLGLRLNFAGKLAANVSLKERDDIFQRYLKQNQAPDAQTLLVTSSVMDYLGFQDDVISGRQILDSQKALPYDALAINWGYSQGEPVAIDRATAPLFCTDSGIGLFGDCDVFTSGAKPLANNAWDITNTLRLLPQHIVEAFIAAKAAPDARDRKPMEEVVLRPDLYARTVVESLARQLSWLNVSARSALIERRLPQVGPLNHDEVKGQLLEWIVQQVNELGGVENVFFSLLPIHTSPQELAQPEGVDAPPAPLVPVTLARLDQLLAQIRTQGFVGADGSPHQFTEEEINLIHEQGQLFVKQVQEHILSQALDVFLSSKLDLEFKVTGSIDPRSLSAALEARLAEVADAILFEEGEGYIGANVHMSPRHSPAIVVSPFRHSFEVRMKAARLLSQNLGAGPDWSLEGRRVIGEKLKGLIENSLGRDLRDLRLNDIARPLRQWFMEQTEILEVIMGEPGCEELLEDHEPEKKEAQSTKAPAAPPRRPLTLR